ncbi:hypothetical protein LBMAG42_03120 [Deltaproteobacteria bacterium]|nr:hypothetical protein LBMAG42_03120 [Deltaproteobacteria bacterium]
MLLILLAACPDPQSSYVPDVTEVDTAPEDTGEALAPLEHCGELAGDATWVATRRHVVTCDVTVSSGTLTVEAGATVSFDENTSLAVGTMNAEASLVVAGETNGVVFAPSGDVAWGGLDIGDTARGVSIAGLSMKQSRNGVSIAGAEVAINGLAIDGAEDACGLSLKYGARLAAGSAGLAVTNAGSWSVCAEVATADSIPAAASSYTGNALDGVYLTGSVIETSVSWENLGVPYVVAETVDVAGTAGSPAVLSLTAGVTVLVERDRSLRFSRTGDASQLVVLGTEAEPVVIDAYGADNPGFWRGIEVSQGADEVRLAYVTVSGAGGDGAGLRVEDTALTVDHVTITLSGDSGIALDGSATFTPESQDLTITTSGGVPLLLPAAAVPSIPLVGLALTGNTVDAVKVDGEAAVPESGTWSDLGVPYWVADDIEIDGTAASPSVITVAAGVRLLFENDTGLYVGKSGAAGLVVEGTEAAPVSFLPWSANTPGAWAGIGVYDNVVDASMILTNAEVGYAGGNTLKGNLHVVDASPTLTNVAIHDGLEWGIYLSGDSAPVLAGVTYTDNEAGTCNACE